MTPGSVAMLLGETTGLRVQTTAPSLGAANVRIQGLRGRYSQLLADGLPLYGARAIRSACCRCRRSISGRSRSSRASRRRCTARRRSAASSISSHAGRAEPRSRRSSTSRRRRQRCRRLARAAPVDAAGRWTLLGGYHGQPRRDLDDDGWSDLPTFDRGVVRPRVFFDNGRGTTLFVTGRRHGRGSRRRHAAGRRRARWRAVPRGAGDAPCRRRVRRALADRRRPRVVRARVASRATASDRHVRRRARARHAADRLSARPRCKAPRPPHLGGRRRVPAGSLRPRELPQFDFTLLGAGGVRAGRGHARLAPSRSRPAPGSTCIREYGTLFSPRVSALLEPSGGVDGPRRRRRRARSRRRRSPRRPTRPGCRALRAAARTARPSGPRRASADVTWTRGPFEVTGTVFGSLVDDPVQPRRGAARGDRRAWHRVGLVNATDPTRTLGHRAAGPLPSRADSR